MCPNYSPADADLGKRRCHERKNPEHRWIMGRRAALQREILRRRLNR